MNNSSPIKKPYIGRFAPSPSGPLHFGSLVSAVASYVDAKAHHGLWLVRMEDLDPPREQAGAANTILKQLEAHHLYWDKDVLYQSQRQAAYQDALTTLSSHCYPCNCKRLRLVGLKGKYDGHCLQQPPAPGQTVAIRLHCANISPDVRHNIEHFDDLLLGSQHLILSAQDDFIVRRKDKLFAYQLAVVVDDAYQQITHIIRGSDLLGFTHRQRYLFHLLEESLPQYGHTPLALSEAGEKLSKQYGAKGINCKFAPTNLYNALQFLGHTPPKEYYHTNHCSDLLNWAIAHWQRSNIPVHSAIAPGNTGA